MILKSLVILAFLIANISSFAQLQKRSLSEPLPTRQIHLDFHTSGFIPGVGEKFSKTQVQEALRLGHVNHISDVCYCESCMKRMLTEGIDINDHGDVSISSNIYYVHRNCPGVLNKQLRS